MQKFNFCFFFPFILSAIKGSKYVIHVASPFPLTIPSDPDELIKPAVDGTLNVLKACTEVGGVKRVVLTSSIVAVYGMHFF